MTKELNIGIVGLGTVGSGVIKSIEKNKEYFNQKGTPKAIDTNFLSTFLKLEKKLRSPNKRMSLHLRPFKNNKRAFSR